MTNTIVLGLGNLVHGDDGVGLHAIYVLQRDPRVPRGVSLIDGGTQGLALLPHLSGVQRLLVIDAIDAAEVPGTLMRFEGKALHGLPGRPAFTNSDLPISWSLWNYSAKLPAKSSYWVCSPCPPIGARN